MYRNQNLYSKELTILVIGGCQVTGYPYSADKGFVHAVSHMLNQEGFLHRMIVRPYYTLNKPERIKSVIDDIQPQVIILQCGHFEFCVPSPTRRLYAWWNKKRNRKTKSINSTPASQHQDEYKSLQVAGFYPGKRYRLMQYIKHTANQMFAYRLYNKLKWEQWINESFAVIKDYAPQHVLVLEPFPCANKITNTYRQKGAALLVQYAARYHFDYMAGVEEHLYIKLGHSIFADEMHINEQAHQVLATKVFEELWELLHSKFNAIAKVPGEPADLNNPEVF